MTSENAVTRSPLKRRSHSFQGIEYELENLTEFEVSHNLYKGRLLVPHQIKETSLRRDLVDEVKKYFDRWLQRIAIVLLQGKFQSQERTFALAQFKRNFKIAFRQTNCERLA